MPMPCFHNVLNVPCGGCGPEGVSRPGVEFPNGLILCEKCLWSASIAMWDADLFTKGKEKKDEPNV
jgi:hypothetical protein